jgi:hypothetical protein
VQCSHAIVEHRAVGLVAIQPARVDFAEVSDETPSAPSIGGQQVSKAIEQHVVAHACKVIEISRMLRCRSLLLDHAMHVARRISSSSAAVCGARRVQDGSRGVGACDVPSGGARDLPRCDLRRIVDTQVGSAANSSSRFARLRFDSFWAWKADRDGGRTKLWKYPGLTMELRLGVVEG